MTQAGRLSLALAKLEIAQMDVKVAELVEALHQSLECLAWRGDETKEQLLSFIKDAQLGIGAAIAKATE